MEYKGWSVDLDRNEIRGPRHYRKKVPAKIAELMHLLVGKKGDVARHEYLISGLWGHDAPETATRILHRYVCTLRLVLPNRAQIFNERQCGYWFKP